MRVHHSLAALVTALAVVLGPALTQAATAADQPPAGSTAPAGDPDFRVERLQGGDRYATAAALSARFHSPGVPVVHVTSGTDFPDALSAGPAADRLGGPVLFVRPDSVPSATTRELTRLRPGRIVVVGGSEAVSDTVLTSLRGMTTGSVTRVAGSTRWATSAAVSAQTFPDGASVVWVSTGRNWPDALSAGAGAGVLDAPVLLTDTTSLPRVVREEIVRLDPDRILLAGGASVVAAPVAAELATIAPTERIAGSDRYGTSLAVSRRVFGPSRPGVSIVTGGAFPDALAAVPATATTRGPVLLSRPGALPTAISGELDRLTPGTAYLAGGLASLSIDVARAVQRERGICWAGPTYPSTESQQILTTVGGTTSKKVAFTLDMGGRLDGATEIIDYLVEHQVCTTFFPTGAMADTPQGRPIMSKIAEHPELFEVGNHTVHHCDLVLGGGGSPSAAPCDRAMTDAFIRAELTNATTVLERLAQMPTEPIWRPPYGSQNARVRNLAAQAGYPVTVMWARDTIDWHPETTTAQIVARTTSPLPASGSIVLAHLGGYRTGAALPQIVSILRSNGYTMTTVSDMRDG